MLDALFLDNNRLDELPDGLFFGLTALTSLDLSGNPNNPMLLTVTVEKAGTDRVRAKVRAGAPFAVNIPVTVVNGTLDGGATRLRVAAGSVDGTPVTLTRTPGTTTTVDVDLTTQPKLPTKHTGYAFAWTRSELSAVLPPFMPTSCTLNPGDVWCGTVTVGKVAESKGKTIGHGFHETWHGAGVGYMHDGGIVSGANSYRIDEAMVEVDGFLFFSLNRAFSDADRARLVLHVGSARFPLSEAHFESSTHTYHWRNTGLDWSSESSVTLRLQAGPAAPTAVTATAPPDTGGLLEVSWTAPALAGSITGYEVKYWKTADPENENRRSRTVKTDSPETNLLLYALLDPGTEYAVRVRAMNAIGTGAWSDVATAPTGAKKSSKPLLSLAVVDENGEGIDTIAAGETFRYRVEVTNLFNHHQSSGTDFTGWGTLGVRGPFAIDYIYSSGKEGCHGRTLFLKDFTWDSSSYTAGYWEFDSADIPANAADIGPLRLRMGFACTASHFFGPDGVVTTTSKSFALGSPAGASLSVEDSSGTVTDACQAGDAGARALKARFIVAAGAPRRLGPGEGSGGVQRGDRREPGDRRRARGEGRGRPGDVGAPGGQPAGRGRGGAFGGPFGWRTGTRAGKR